VPNLPEVLNVLILQPIPEAAVERIKSVAAARLNVIDASAEFRALSQGPIGPGRGGPPPRLSDGERDALINDAHVVYSGVSFPHSFVAKAKNLVWAHFAFAGTSNLKDSEWWGTPFITTSSRGYTAALPIAEAVIAGMLMMARRLDLAVENSRKGVYDASAFTGIRLIDGKTLAVIGLGGIGAHVARLAKGLGMRVIASRRSVATRTRHAGGVDELFPPADLLPMLAEADFVAVCAMWTEETERMLNREAFAAMKDGAYLMNVARGEIIDNDAMAEALRSGKLAGAYLDVWDDDFRQPPPQVLRDAPNIVFTPHVSNRSDTPQMFAVDVFCKNLERLLRGEALENAVDWQRGY
jgi:phosphoglycerate dehydrogenase-like enzyme